VKVAARLVAVLGAMGLGLFLFRHNPREVVLVYDLTGVAEPRDLRVAIVRGAEVMRRAEFPSPSSQVRHAVRLPDGSYRLDYHVEARGGPVQGERELTISEGGTIVLSLAPLR
jgi:hypothetical protein